MVFLISGLWHGAGFKFLFWGFLHAFYQMAGAYTEPVREKLYSRFNIADDSKLKSMMKQAGCFIFVMTAWIFFRADNLKTGADMVIHMVTDFNPWVLFDDSILAFGLVWKELVLLLVAIVIMWLVDYAHYNNRPVGAVLKKQCFLVRATVYILAIVGIMIFGTYGYGFSAQDFIYGGF